MAGELILRSEIKLRSSSIFLKIFGSKIWKVSRCRPAVSNETILAVRQELLFTKNTSRAKHNWHCIIGFLINAALLNVFFNLLYHYFFVKKFIFLNVCISVNTIFECLYMFLWLRKGPSITYVRNWQLVGNWRSSQMRAAAYRGESVTGHVYVHTYTISFHVFGSIFVL